MNWGTGVVIAMVSFMIFILTFVYRSVVMDEYQHELVSEDYYKDELHYQEEIDKLNNAAALEVNLTVSRTSEGLLLRFPGNLEPGKISGSIRVQRPSKKALDIELPVQLSGYEQLIPDEKLVSGKYLISVDWKHGESEYLFKEELFY